MMSEDYLMCSCGWVGTRQELVSIDRDSKSFIYCPGCKKTDELESEEE
jgi:hypothetical protein